MKKGKIGEYFIQLIIVIIGVYVGMLASDWNSKQKLKEQRIEILNGIKNEMIANKIILDSLHARRIEFYRSHDSVRYKFDSSIWTQEYSTDLFETIYTNWKGIGNPRLSSAMFEVAKYGQILPGLNLELVNKVSQIYELQITLSNLNDTYIDRFFEFRATNEYGASAKIDMVNTSRTMGLSIPSIRKIH